MDDDTSYKTTSECFILYKRVFFVVIIRHTTLTKINLLRNRDKRENKQCVILRSCALKHIQFITVETIP